MANGQQKAIHNLEAFQVLQATQSDDDFKQIIFRRKLNSGEIAKAVGCGKSALNQKPKLNNVLVKLESTLREKGVLLPLIVLIKESLDKAKHLTIPKT